MLRALLFLLAAWLGQVVECRRLRIAKNAAHVAQAVADVSLGAVVRRPLTDQRRYEHVTFIGNGLRVLAVQDPRAAKAGIALAVEAGSFYDPPELPGLAHLCEHLLFLGTQKYPDEASFDEFMSRHDGNSNAYTEQERTVFYNEVGYAGFEEAMDRFAQFFIAPLFKGEMVGRELDAVNSEHEKNRPDAGRRLWELLRRTAGEASVLGRFYTGTADSLRHGDEEAVAALRRYHDENYCAPRMHLVIVSNLTTAQQLAAAHRHFDGMPRGHCGPPRDFGNESARAGGKNIVAGAPAAFSSKQLGQMIRLGTNSTPMLWMMFPLAPMLGLYREAPLQYLEYVLGYAGPKSLRSRLKNRGLITGLGLQADETSAATLFFLTFDLTPKGAMENGVEEIGESTFEFLRLLHEEAGGDVPFVYDSLRRMSQVSFDYTEAPDSVMDAVSDLAQAATRYPPENILTGPNGVIDRADSALVRRLLATLSDPGAANLALATPAFNATSANRFEKYYGINYLQEGLPMQWFKQWQDVPEQRPGSKGGEMRAPPALRYVPMALHVGNASSGVVPKAIDVHPMGKARAQPGPSLELWWKGRSGFALPKAQLRLELGLPATNGSSSAKGEALRRLHAELARQLLEEPMEDLRNCGLDFEVQPLGTGYRLKFDGYNEHLGSLLLEVLRGLMEPNFGPTELARAKRQLRDELADTSRLAPYELAAEALSALTTDNAFARTEVLDELGRIDEGRLRAYLVALRSNGLRMRLLVVGNVEEAAARDLASRAAELVVGPVSESGHRRGRLLTVAEAVRAHVLAASKPVELRMRNPIPGDANHATLNVYQYGVPDVSERVRMLLLGRMIANPVYDTLRTKKQLGYVVFGFVSEQVSVLELRVLVQGARELPDSVDGDIEAVLEEFGARLRVMPPSEFLVWKASLRSALHIEDQNMAQEADRYWAQIVSDGHCFNRKELALQYLEQLQSVDEVVETYEALRRGRRKVSVKLFGAGSDPVAAGAALSQSAASTKEAAFLVDGPGAAQKERLTREVGAGVYPAGGICKISK
mmetsp:Transcript_63689/g.136886  ORF Transcript_63689/g.136886 Transcript_63689/m.136886 type:complete len:1047 (+) Transcript_63689:167-3307(+)